MAANWEDIVLDPKNTAQAAVATGKWRYNGDWVEVDVIKPRNGDGWICLVNTGVRIATAPTALIDSLHNWRPYG